MIYPTPYLSPQSLGRIRQAYIGGFCRWWYTPKQNIAFFPEVSPVTQQLNEEPIIKDGTSWYGPVTVPDKKLGWQENQKMSKAGLYYENKVEGVMPGIDANAHANLGNMAYQQFIIVGKLRAGGHLVILGNPLSGLSFTNSTYSGQGANEVGGNTISFTGESIYKSLMLPAFTASSQLPTDEELYTGGEGSYAMAEVIVFTNETEVTVAYNSTRRAKYGDMPEIEVWFTITEDGIDKIIKANVEITMDAPPPNQTLFTINLGGVSSGFIRLGK